MTTTISPVDQLSEYLTRHLGGDPCWHAALTRLAGCQSSLHLAVLVEPFCGWLLDGSKTIESRFSKVRCAPHGCLAEGDVVAVKRSGGPVAGAFQAGTVRAYHLTQSLLIELREQYAEQIRATGEEFWEQRADCAYATLVDVSCVRTLPGLPFPKKDRRGWVQLTRPDAQQTLL
jgi:hypothetical protein